LKKSKVFVLRTAMPLDGYFVGLLVAISAITGSAAVVGGNVTAFEEKDAKNISGDGLNAMLHAVRKRQTEESGKYLKESE
jgi:hypothetical protein